jgi:hypothetical protein
MIPSFITQVRAALARRGFTLDGNDLQGTLVVQPTRRGAQVKVVATYASLAELQRAGQAVYEALEADGFDAAPDLMGETTVYAPEAALVPAAAA